VDVLKINWLSAADAIAPYPALQAVLVVLVFLFLAMVVDQVCSRALVRLLARTDTATGNRIIELLHRPVYVTVMLIGLVFASNRLSLSEPVNNILYGVVGTILVLVWSVTMHRLSGVVFTAMVRNDRRYSFAHPATAPVFRNAIAVLLSASTAYWSHGKSMLQRSWHLQASSDWRSVLRRRTHSATCSPAFRFWRTW
jgi:MscS family membrane protein